MPTNVVKTPREEHKWQDAKRIAAQEGRGKNYAYIMGIFKKMNPLRFGQHKKHAMLAGFMTEMEKDAAALPVGSLLKGIKPVSEALGSSIAKALPKSAPAYSGAGRQLMAKGKGLIGAGKGLVNDFNIWRKTPGGKKVVGGALGISGMTGASLAMSGAGNKLDQATRSPYAY